MRLRHLRAGRELPDILSDSGYDFNFQASRDPAGGERLVLPGDELIMDCQYETARREEVTFGGLSTRDEMCLGFILYYPRSRLADCRSLPTPKTFLSAFGVREVQGGAFDKLAAFLGHLGEDDQEKEEEEEESLQVSLRDDFSASMPTFIPLSPYSFSPFWPCCPARQDVTSLPPRSVPSVARCHRGRKTSPPPPPLSL